MAPSPSGSSPSSGTYYFDKDAAQRAVDFFAECLTHVKGDLAGEPFLLEPWQERDIIRPMFGWKVQIGARRNRETDPRKYRTVYVEVPRKNGKSSLSAGVALYLLAADGEAGAEVYSCAADTDQAAIVFDVAKLMRLGSPDLRKRLKPYKRALVYLATASSYKVLSADALTKHGFNAHGICFDELHAQPDRELYDVMTTSTASRRQSMMFITTTAGYDRLSICWEVHEYALKVRDGTLTDESFLPVIYAAGEADPWDSQATWEKANPGLGVTVKLDYLEREAQKARESLAYQNTFRRLHLNQWTEQMERAIDMEVWNEASAPAVDPEALRGRKCFGGLDLASTSDIAAFVLLFPPEEPEEPYIVLPRFWVPKDTVAARSRKGNVRYDAWVQQGLIEATDGNEIDQQFIRKAIVEDGKRYDIREIAYDRWGMVGLSTQLVGDGFTMVPIGQGFNSMAAPTKEFLSLVAQRKVAHGGNPVLRWMASNTAVKQDAAGNLKPDKGASSEKIDGIVAIVMSLAREMVHVDDGPRATLVSR